MTTWRLLGPTCVYNGQLGYKNTGRGPVSGRVTALAFHPTHADEIYVGTAGSGVWVSENAGLTWEPLMEDKQNFSIGALAFEPVAPFRLFIAPGEPNTGGFVFSGTGIHVYNTTAKTWEYHAGPGSSFERVFSGALVAFQKDGDTKVLLGNSNGVFHWDAAAGWTDLSAGLPAAPRVVTSLAYNSDTETIHACLTGTNPGVYRKAVGGAWQPQCVVGDPQKMLVFVTQGRSAVANCHTSPGKIYAALGSSAGDRELLAIYVSTDDGVTWQLRTIPSETKSTDYNMVLAVHPALSDNLYFGGTKLWKSTTGGAVWTVVSEPGAGDEGVHADQHALVFHPTATSAAAPRAGEMWLGNDGGVWRSTDHGESWAPRNRGLSTMQYYSLAQHPDHPTVLLAGAQDNGVQRYEGASCWNLVGFGDGFFCAIDHEQQNVWFSSYIFQPDQAVESLQAVQRSEKAGAPGSWSYTVQGIATNDTTDSDPFYVPFVIHPEHHEILYLATSRVYRSTNSGTLWQPIALTTGTPFTTGTLHRNRITAIDAHPTEEVVYIGTADGRVFRLARDPATDRWTATQKNIAAAGELISDVAIAVDGDTTHVYASVGSEHVPWRPVVAVASRIFHHDESVAGDNFVARGNVQLDVVFDATTLTPQVIPHAFNPVNAIAVDPRFPARPYIGCNYGGVFRADSFGQSWASAATGLPNTPVNDLIFQPKHKLLRAATLGRSIWELDVDAASAQPIVNLHIRASVVDSGKAPAVVTGPDPFDSGKVLDWTHSPDIIVDTAAQSPTGSFQAVASTDTYEPNGKADYISFHHFQSRLLREGKESRIYARVHNRGMMAADADVRLFYAPKGAGGGFPDLQEGFWDIAWDGTADQFEDWKPVGDKVSVPVPPAQAGVATWMWETPSGLGAQVGLLAVTTAPLDPIGNSAPLAIQQLVENQKRAALREVTVGLGDDDYAWVPVLIIVGLAVVAVAVGVGVGAAESQQT